MPNGPQGRDGRTKGPSGAEERVEEAVSAEYKRFLEEERLGRIPLTMYEKACAFAEKIIHIEPGKKEGGKMQDAIDFAHLRIRPTQVTSLTLLFLLIVCVPTFLFLLTGIIGTMMHVALPGISISIALFVFIAAIPLAIYLYQYPLHLRKRYEMSVGADMVSAILYMVVYMRNVPSLEGAADFAARNLSGPLAAELRKLMWDVRVGTYLSVDEALLEYAKKWKNNREFVEAVELLITSLRQTGPRAQSLMDEAVRVILEGNKESAEEYVRGLKMPIMVIHSMGLVLPVMGLVLFPILAIFLSVSAFQLFLVYDIMLPLGLFFMIARALEKRPATYSRIDISLHPDLPPPGKFFIGKKKAVPAWPFALFIGALIIGTGLLVYTQGITCTDKGCLEDESKGLIKAGEGRVVLSWAVLGAIIVTLGLAIGPSVYFLLLSRGRAKLRSDVQKIEGEFKEALFQLGTVLGGGAPIETAMVDALKRMEGLKVKDMFQRAAFNMQRFGMTFEKAFFDEKQGAIIFYPSLTIRSILRAVVEAARKGVRNAAMAMISVAQYLRGVHGTQMSVQESLSDVTNSLKFQAYALSPIISGTIATMAVIIIRILQQLSAQMAAIGGTGAGAGLGGVAPIMFGNLEITPFQFILVVSIYLVESLFLLSYLSAGIEYGEDSIGRGEMTGGILLVGTIFYTITTIGTLMVFAPLTGSLVA